MKNSVKALLLAAAFTSTGALADECNLGDMPTLPSGATASMEEMVAGQQAVKAFQTEAQTYRSCLDEEMNTIREAADDGDKTSAEAFKTLTDAYNASVAAEEEMANEFNAQIREYKAANPS
jgi:hypothetical protein